MFNNTVRHRVQCYVLKYLMQNGHVWDRIHWICLINFFHNLPLKSSMLTHCLYEPECSCISKPMRMTVSVVNA